MLYVTNQHADSVSVIDARTHAVVATVPIGGYPEGMAAHGDRVYVVNWMDDNVAVLDARTGGARNHRHRQEQPRLRSFIGAP